MPADENLSIPVHEKKWRLGFWSLIAAQFQGAFNENALKFLVIYLILAVEKDKAQRDQLELLVGVLFAAPFILFSLTGGYLADRFSKRAVSIWTKVFEVGVMLFATAAVVGQRRPRTWDFPRHHRRERERFFSRRGFRRARGLFGGAAAWFYDRWFGLELWDQPRTRRGPRKEIPSHLSDRCLVADESDSQRPRAVASGAGQHLLLFRRCAAAIQHIYLRARRAAYSLDAGRFPAGGCGHRNRPGQFCRGISLGRTNRVWINSSRFTGHDIPRTLPGDTGLVVPCRLVAAGGAGLLRR